MKTNRQKNYTISKENAFNLPICPGPDQPASVQDEYPTTIETLAGPSYDGFCLATPEKYQITIYEMGLCTSDPLKKEWFDSTGSSVYLNKESCVTTLTSKSGVPVNLAGKTTADNLPPASARPASKTYRYAYIILKNQFGMKGSYTINNGAGGTTTYYSKKARDKYGEYGGTKTKGPAEDFTETLRNMNLKGDSYNAYMFPQTMPGGGKVSALLLKDNKITRAVDGFDAKSMVGSFETNSGNPVIITDQTGGLEVELQVTNTGWAVGLNEEGTAIDFFGSAPFKPVFRTF